MIASIRPWLKFAAVFFALCWFLGRLLILSAIKGRSIERGFLYRRKFCKAALSILNIKYLHTDQQIKGACLYVSNHRSMLDPLIQLSWLDAFIVSKAEVGSYPVLGRGAKETGIILVHRHDHNSRKAALEAIESTLLSGYPVLIYPEGTTYGGDLTGEFRKGAIELAFSRGIPIVPVMIEYPNAEYYWTDIPLLTYFTKIFRSGSIHQVFGSIGRPMANDRSHTLVSDTRACIDAMILQARKRTTPSG